MAVYLTALDGFPAWAIMAAVKAFLRGSVAGQSTQFCPKAPELATRVKAELAPVYREHENRLRNAERRQERRAEREHFAARTDAEKARMAARYAEFCASSDATKATAGPVSSLDPELLAQVPDAPMTFERLNWLKRQGRAA